MIKLIDNMDLIEPEVPEDMSSNKLILNINDEIAEDILQEEYNRRHPERICWTMRDGSKINIKDMTDEHLLNTIKLLKRKRIERETFYDALCGFPD